MDVEQESSNDRSAFETIMDEGSIQFPQVNHDIYGPPTSS